MSGDIATFESHRARLLNLAYRMLGEWSAAEDVVQETWLRWRAVDPQLIRDPRAWLSTAATRLSLDALRAAKARREIYVGPWLPEPMLPEDMHALAADGTADAVELASDLSFALMHVLERLSPEERAAFILREAFDFSYDEIAAALDKAEPACRKLVSRARERAKSGRPRYSASKPERLELMARFAAAAQVGDAKALADLFAPEAIAYTDGGGRARAALNPIVGPDRIARFFVGLQRKYASVAADWRITEFNGEPAVFGALAGDAPTAIAFEAEDGRITAIYVQRNPDKLARVRALFGAAEECR